MSGHRKSYQRTVLAALLVAAMAIVVGGALSVMAAFAIAPALLLGILAVPCFAFAFVALWTAAGGMIALKRDALEARGQAYYSTQPRERQPGLYTRLRRVWLTAISGSSSRLHLWPGEWVQIRPYAEIAATLDATGQLDGLPFMPEMLRYCGQRQRVLRRIDKVHDYVHHSGLRRMRDSVLLEKLRCDGAQHGGCQAGCQFIWKEAWLTPASLRSSNNASSAVTDDARIDARLTDNVKVILPDGELRYRCQMTQLPQATSPLGWGDPRHYLRDLYAGNVRFSLWMTTVALALFNYIQVRRGGITAPYREANDRKSSPTELSQLMPGERVRIKPKPVIEQTLNSNSRNRGLWFDVEMHRFCGAEFKVGARVERMIEEASGKLLTLGNPCIILENVSATGEYLGNCPQNELIYWREIWLERVITGAAAPSAPLPTAIGVPDNAA